jgi:O-antigen/teichoic acid export membrane protein
MIAPERESGSDISGAVENVPAEGERVRGVVQSSGDVRLRTPPARDSAADEAAQLRELADHEIRGSVLSGFKWSMASAGVIQLVQIVTSIVLIRLLSPRDYGLAGMTLLFQGIVVVVADVSLGAALVQRREITEADRSTVFWCTAAIGALLTVSGIALAGPLADFYHQPAVRPLFAVLSVSFVLTALQMTPQALLDRELQFRLVNLRIGGAAIAGYIVAVTAAILGAGAWALVLGQVATSASGLLLIWACCSWRPRFLFSWNSVRNLGSYGMRLCGSNMLSYVTYNADNLMVGRFLGSAALGAYSVAFSLMFLPAARVIFPITMTLFPAFSRWQDDHKQIAEVWLRVLRVIGAVLIPAMIGFIVVAPDFVDVILGNKWRPAVPVLQWLAVVALAQGMALVGQRVLAAVDKTKIVFRFAVLNTIALIGAFALGLQWGIVGVSICYAAVSVPLQIFYLGLTARAVSMSILEVARTLLGVMAASAVMVASCLALRSFLVSVHAVPVARLAAVTALGILVYGGMCLMVVPELLAEIRTIRTRRHLAKALPVAA